MPSSLFDQCIEGLAAHVVILNKQESDKIFDLFENKVSIYQSGSRIDWEKIDKKITIDSPDQTISALEQLLQKPDTTVYVFWNDGSLPVIKTDINLVLLHFEDVICVGFETWLYNPHQGYIIEYYYLGDMHVGLVNKST